MNSQELISITLKAGYEVKEYEGHYCVKKQKEMTVVVTIPKVEYLVKDLIEKIKEILDLK